MENYVQDRTEIKENRRMHPTMSKRHKKYKIIASSMLKKRKHHELIKDVLDKTGLAKLLQKYPEQVQKQEQIVDLVNQFIADRLKHQVHIKDEDSILIPLSLSAVKRELDHIATSL